MAESIRIGVIGCGQFMSRQHIQTIARSDHLQLHFLADQNEQKLAQIAQWYKPQKTSTKWEDVVQDPQVDVVVAGILPAFHPAIAKAALQNGKPAYIEKPLTEDLKQGIEIQQLAAKANKPVAVGFNRRFAPAVQLIDQQFRNASGPFTMLYRISDDDRIRPPDQQWKLQDRLLIEIVHIFDLLCYLTRSEPKTIYAVESRPNDALITLEFTDGSHATILSSSWGSLAQPKEHFETVLDRTVLEMDDFVEVRCFGDDKVSAKTCFAGRPYDRCDNRHVEQFQQQGLSAMIELRRRYYQALQNSGVLIDSGNKLTWQKANKLMGDPPIPQINYTPDKGWGIALEEFCIRAVRGETPRNADAIDGNRASACALAARKSIETKTPISLSPDNWR